MSVRLVDILKIETPNPFNGMNHEKEAASEFTDSKSALSNQDSLQWVSSKSSEYSGINRWNFLKFSSNPRHRGCTSCSISCATPLVRRKV
jgi:hypothetical protein